MRRNLGRVYGHVVDEAVVAERIDAPRTGRDARAFREGATASGGGGAEKGRDAAPSSVLEPRNNVRPARSDYLVEGRACRGVEVDRAEEIAISRRETVKE